MTAPHTQNRPDLLTQAEWYQLDADPYWRPRVRRERLARALDAALRFAAYASAATLFVTAIAAAILAR